MIYHQEELSFRIISVGRVKHRNGHFSVKARPYAAFAYRLSGRVDFIAQGNAFSSEAGDVTYIPAFVPYEADYTEGESIVLHMQGMSYAQSENLRQGGIYILRQFEEMERAWQEGDTHLVRSLFFRILHLLAKSEKEDEDESLLAAVRFLETRLYDPTLLLTEVASAGFMSIATLRRKFEKRYGVSPKEYLLRRRLELGVSLLIGGAPVKKAARECGFADEKLFSRTVKARYGVPPSAIRSL